MNQRRKKTCWREHSGGMFTEAQSNSGTEGIYTYSTVPGLGKQRGERENTVNMRVRGSVGGVQRRHSGRKHHDRRGKKNMEGRPVEFLV